MSIVIEIQAFYENGNEILGNLDGQSLYECKDYKRTGRYKALREVKHRPIVNHWKVFSKPSKFSDELTLLEIVENK